MTVGQAAEPLEVPVRSRAVGSARRAAARWEATQGYGFLLPALVLLLLFVGGISYNVARGRSPDCHCFGQLHSAPAG